MKKDKKLYTGVIYTFTNTVNGKVYVGQTTKPRIRKSQHFKAAINFLDNSVFHKAIRKYGFDSFTYRIEKIIACNSYDLYRKRIDFYEREFIKFYDSMKRGYNMTSGGGYVWDNSVKRGIHLSEEHKKKISETLKKKGITKNNSLEHNPKAKKVICKDENGNIIKIYNCAKYICSEYNINYSVLRKKLQNKNCIINGLTFYYEIATR